MDLEAYEMSIRSAMHRVGCRMLEKLINSDGGGYRGASLTDADGHACEFVDYREKTLLTALGELRVKRSYYFDPEHHAGFCPKDRDLDIEGTSYSPGVRRMVSRVGAWRPFALAGDDLHELADIRVDAKAVERISHMVGSQVASFLRKEKNNPLPDNISPIKSVANMYVGIDGTGVPVVKKETAGRKGKSEDGEAKTRECKIGCVFTQSAVDRDGYAVRDEGTTSYIGAIETSDAFGERIYEEAVRRGMERAREVCVLGDGAAWIWNIADMQFYGATQIVDLYHAREHYWSVARACFGQDKEKMCQWAEERRCELDNGKPEDVVKAIKSCLLLAGCDKAACEKEMGYFTKNKERMRYADFRKRGLFVGSGVVEAGCRTVVAQRLKQSGMHWTVKGADNIVALRCCVLSNRWEDFWEQRTAA